MGACVVGSVEMSVGTDDTDSPENFRGRAVLDIRMLGPLGIARAGETRRLPASRKVRALFAYLALAPQAVTRSQLCELLWDVPNDPRGELRWCLSKIRGVVDEPGPPRVTTRGDAVRIDLSDCHVDTAQIAQACNRDLKRCRRSDCAH